MKIYNSPPTTKMHLELINSLKKLRQKRNFDEHVYLDKKTDLINHYFQKYNLDTAVIGISGGIDSAITLGLIKNASDKNNSPIKKIIPVFLPIYNSKGTTNQKLATAKGKELTSSLNLSGIEIDLEQSYQLLKKTIDKAFDAHGEPWAAGQLVSYVRTPVLYYITSLFLQKNAKAIVLGTINRDEGAYLGFFSKSSDGMVDVQIISDLHKSEVYRVAKLLAIPDSILLAKPSGDMFDGRTDETVFGTTFDFVELYLLYLCSKEQSKKQLVKNWSKKAYQQFLNSKDKLEKLHQYNLHKYLGYSPAIHLDVYPRTVPGGWSK